MHRMQALKPMIACIAVASLGCAGEPDRADAELHRGNGPEPGTLDPHVQYDESAGRIVADLFEGLTVFGVDHRALPGAASAWSVDADGLTWRFELRDGARWCNGDAVTAGHFAAGLTRSMDPETAAPLAGLLAPIAGVEAPDPATLVIRLSEPMAALPEILALPVASAVHPTETEYREPLGNGAYCFTERRHQSHIRLDRNPYHADADRHAIATVYYHTIEDLDAEFNRYRAGELHVTVSVPPGRIGWIVEHLSNELRSAPILASAYIGFNLALPPFAGNRDLRRALSLAIDRERFAELVFDGLVEPAYGLVPPFSDYPPAPRDWVPRDEGERLAAAHEAYGAAGFDARNPVSFTFHYPAGGPSPRIAAVLSAMWREALGADIELNPVEWKVYLAAVQGGDTPGVFRYAWGADFADPSAFLRVFDSTSHAAVFGYRSAAFNALLQQARAEPDQGARLALLAEAEAVLVDDVAFVPLYYDTSRRLVKPAVAGWRPNVLDHHPTRFLALTR